MLMTQNCTAETKGHITLQRVQVITVTTSRQDSNIWMETDLSSSVLQQFVESRGMGNQNRRRIASLIRVKCGADTESLYLFK